MAETFGAELRRLREAAGLTPEDLDRLCSYPAGYSAGLEGFARWPERGVVNYVAVILNLDSAAARRLHELAFLARGECCPRCGFGGEE